jgi:glycerophosphoryl diester phosphodiesterase
MSVPEPLLRDGAAPVVIAHRGACAVAPENTMAAFRAAWEAGARWLETDVQPTADAGLVLIHDDEVDRTTDGIGQVRELTTAALTGLDAGFWFGPSFAGAPVPTVDDLLAEITGDRRLLLEIKGEHTPDQVASIVQAVRAAGAEQRVLLQSFEVPVLRRLRAILPVEPIGLLVEDVGDDPVGDCHDLGAVTYNPYVGAVLERPEVVETLHAAGIAMMPWTSDDPEQWMALSDLGVDGIITNDPAALLGWQDQRAAGGPAS